MTSASDDDQASFGSGWDEYVEHAHRRGQDWPGDDWGDATLWDGWFDRLLRPFGVSDWSQAVEIGQGTGRYTERALGAGCREILAADVAQSFLDLCATRQRAFVDAGRLHFAKLEEDDPHSLANAAAARGWAGSVDAVFAIDAFVHLPLTLIAAYLRDGIDVLRPGGVFVFTFAEGRTPGGLQKLVGDIDRTVRGRGHPRTGCFHWVTGGLVRDLAKHLGYEVLICDVDPLHHRDGHFVGRRPTG